MPRFTEQDSLDSQRLVLDLLSFDRQLKAAGHSLASVLSRVIQNATGETIAPEPIVEDEPEGFLSIDAAAQRSSNPAV